MNQTAAFHIVTVGWDRSLIEGVCDRIAAKSNHSFSHIVHPMLDRDAWGKEAKTKEIFFFRDDIRIEMPPADPELLASLEQEGVPTIHNMILSDRIVSKLSYGDALGYATFLTQRMLDLFGRIKPSVIIGGFDDLHGSLGLAVAKRMHIPWFALNFSVIPPALACFCDRMSPTARVFLNARPAGELFSLAETLLQQFEGSQIQVPAYIPPSPLSLAAELAKLPKRLSALHRTIRKSRLREFLQFTEPKSGHSVSAALLLLRRVAIARKAVSKVRAVKEPPATPYVLYGLHMQPESGIDVWAPFFSNQLRVIELLSRSIPPTHKLLVKIHKSDISNYSREQLESMRTYPAVELVSPFADTRKFIQNADLIVSIQGTIGLEAALLGKPVIMLGDSPVTLFPSACRIGELPDLPMLVRRKLTEPAPSRSAIVHAYASYLAPFLPTSYNDWRVMPSENEIDNYIILFDALRQYLEVDCSTPQT